MKLKLIFLRSSSSKVKQASGLKPKRAHPEGRGRATRRADRRRRKHARCQNQEGRKKCVVSETEHKSKDEIVNSAK